MLSWLIENTLVASVLAAVLLASSRWLEKRPAVGNFGWLLVIVLIVMPPMPRLFSPGVRSTITAPVAWVGGLFESDEPVRTTRRSTDRSGWGTDAYPGSEWGDASGDQPYGSAVEADTSTAYRNDSKNTLAATAPAKTSKPTEPTKLESTKSAPPTVQGIAVNPEYVAIADEPSANPPLVWPADELAGVPTIDIEPIVMKSVEGTPIVALESPAKVTNSTEDFTAQKLAQINAKTSALSHESNPGNINTDSAQASQPAPLPAAPKRPVKPFNTKRALAIAGVVGLGAWVLGLVFVAWRQAGRVRSMRTIERASQENEQLTARVAAISERFGVRPPRTIVSEHVDGPMVWNLGRSVLVWPASMPVGTTGTDGMIAHELAHLRRGDHWAAWLELAAITLFWWHPLVWVAHRRAREFAELACDAWVSWVLPSDRRAYAEALVTAASKRAELESRGGRGGPALAFGVVESSRDDFKRRLTMVMTGRGSRRLPPAIAAAGLGLVMMLAPSVAGELTGKPPATVQIEGLDQIDPVFRPVLQRQAILRQARQLENQGDTEGAASLYEQAIKLGAEARGELAMMYYNAEMWDQGREAFVAAYKEEGQDADDLYNAACCAALGGDAGQAVKLLKKSVEAGYSDGDHLMSDSDLDSIHDRDDVKQIAELANSIEELDDLADEASDEEEWGEAAKAYAKLAELVPAEPDYLMMAGYASIMAGDLDAGRAWLKKQADAGYKVETAKYNMACIESLAGNTSKALSWLEQAVEEGFDSHQLMREDDDLDAIRGTDRYAAALKAASRTDRLRKEMELEAEFGEWDAVESKAQALLDSGADESGWAVREARQMIARAAEKRGDYDAAIDAILDNAKASEDSGDAHASMLAIARNYAKAGKIKKGAEYLAATIDAYGDHNGNSGISFSFGGGGDYTIAINNGHYGFNIGSDQDNDSEALKKLYEHPLVKAAQQRQRDRQELAQFDAESWSQLEHDARADLEENGEDGGAYLRLGWALLRQMKLDQAIDAFEGLDQYGSSQLAAYNIACCHAVGGDADEAFEYLDKAVELGFSNAGQYEDDPDLDSLHSDPRWAELMQQLRAKDHDHDADEADGERDVDADWDEEDADWDADEADWDDDEI